MANSPIVRKEIRDLDAFELQEFLYAFYLLTEATTVGGDATLAETVQAMQDRGDVRPVWPQQYISNLHRQWASLHAAHCHTGNQSFLAWHRRYMAILEDALRKVYLADWALVKPANAPEGYDPASMALHYWNYTKTNTVDELVVPNEFRAEDVIRGAEIFTNRPSPRLAKIPNPLFYANRGSDYIEDIAQVLGAPADGQSQDSMRNLIASAMRQSTFANFHPTLEFLPHNRMHVLVGGFMANPSTAGLDPIFALHHSNIDRLWWEWQRSHSSHGAVNGNSLTAEMEEALKGWFQNKGLHWRGLLESPISPLDALLDPEAGPPTEVLREAFLRDEVLNGTPGVEYSSQVDHEPDWGAGPITNPDTVFLSLPHYDKIAGSYKIHVFLFKEGDTRPSTADAAASDDYEHRRLCTIATFGRDKCNCTAAELKIKTEFTYRVKVTGRLREVAESMSIGLDQFDTGSLPEGVEIVMVPVHAAGNIVAGEDHEFKEEARHHDAGCAHSGAGHSTPSLTAIHIKEGSVSRFPWAPELEVFRYEDIVARLGVFTRCLPFDPALEESKGDDGTAPIPARRWPKDKAEASSRSRAPVLGALNYVKEWDASQLHITYGSTGTGVRVGVVDSGIDLTHDDLDDLEAAVHRSGDARLRWRDFTSAKSRVPCDELGHGTLTATLLAGDVDGICPDATLFVARVFKGRRRAEWADIEAALKWLVRSSVHIIVLPLGGVGSNRGVARQLYKAIAEGIIVMAGAGTDVNDGGEVLFPARLPGVLAVAATTNAADCTAEGSGRLAHLRTPGSSHHVGIDLVAPGVCSVGMAADRRTAAGSSIAVAHAAGVVALTLGAANKDNLAFADRDLRAISNSSEWMTAAALAGADTLDAKALSPARVMTAMEASGALTFGSADLLSMLRLSPVPPPPPAPVQLRVAGLITAKLREGVSDNFMETVAAALRKTGAEATVASVLAALGSVADLPTDAMELPRLQLLAVQTLVAWLRSGGEPSVSADNHGRDVARLTLPDSAPVVFLKQLVK